MSPHALISGAGIAGPALAHQLAARGWQTTIVERFAQRRDEGHNIDVRGAAREVAGRMCIEGDIRTANTTEVCRWARCQLPAHVRAPHYPHASHKVAQRRAENTAGPRGDTSDRWDGATHRPGLIHRHCIDSHGPASGSVSATARTTPGHQSAW